MYYLAKIAQATGLTVITLGFLRNFPNLMSHKLLVTGILMFVFGWIIHRFLLKP